MYFCPGVPVRHLDLIKQSRLFLIEASLFRQYEEVCDLFFATHAPVIVDNSPTVYGDSNMTFEGKLNVADSIHRPLVILPDVKWDSKATIKEIQSALAVMRTKRYPKPDPEYLSAPRYVAVAQGDTWDSFWECYKIAAQSGAVLVGIPHSIKFSPPDGQDGLFASITKNHSESFRYALNRSRLIRHLYMVQRSGLRGSRPVRLHLLGMTHPAEFSFYGKMGDFVFSADSTVPFRCAMEGISLVPGDDNYLDADADLPPRKANFFQQEVDADVIELYQRNEKAIYQFYEGLIQIPNQSV